MSRAFDAKTTVLRIYPKHEPEAIDLFLGYLDISEEDFTYEFNQTPEKYVYG